MAKASATTTERRYAAGLANALLALLCLLVISPLTLAGKAPVDYRYRVLATFPHDPGVFTQGLEYRDGRLYESAGQYGESRLLVRGLDSSQAQLQRPLPRHLFAEGITLLGDRIFQLTWRAGTGLIYRRDDLEPLGQFRYAGEGWGLCNDGRHLIISDGSSTLRFLDPNTFAEQRRIDVTVAGRALRYLNELEWVDGLIYANVWHSDWLVMIDPEDGRVVGRVNLQGLLPAALRSRRTDVLNGIAYDRAGQRLLVTGKYWPQLFHIELARVDD